MTGTRIGLSINVRLFCPACHAEGFQYEPGDDPDLRALVECSMCGWEGSLGELDIVPEPTPKSEIN
jgi:hypothetical protein